MKYAKKPFVMARELAAKAVGPVKSARYLKRYFTDYVATQLIRKWDAKHGVDTGGRIPLNSNGIEVAGVHARSAYDVVSTPPRVFAHVANFFPKQREDYSY